MNVTSSPATLAASEVSVAAVVIDELTTTAAKDPEVSQHHSHMELTSCSHITYYICGITISTLKNYLCLQCDNPVADSLLHKKTNTLIIYYLKINLNINWTI